MAPGAIEGELQQASARICQWQAELRGTFWAAAALAALCLLSGTDLFLQYGRTGRIVVWSLLLLVIAGALVHLWITLHRRRTTVGIAALIENAFPELDNHLINYVQFAGEPSQSRLQTAYLRRGVPEWSGIDLRRMRDRRAYIRSYIVCGLAVLFLVTPFFLTGEAWSRAVRRVLNPFSNLPPKTIATLLAVQPGDATVIQGQELLLTCRAQGRKGQPVEVDLWPADDKNSTAILGQLAGSEPEEFTFRIPKATAALDYRFRAGDAPPSDRFHIKVRAPLAFTSLRLTITPPEYTGLVETEADGLAGTITIPQGSRVQAAVQCNQPLARAAIGAQEGGMIAMVSSDEGVNWSGGLTVTSGRVLRVVSADSSGEELKTEVKFQLLPDQVPAIRVIAPVGKAVLAPGTAPRVEFEVSDDYGLTKLAVQRIARGERDSVEGETVTEWPLTGDRLLSTNWAGTVEDVENHLAYRLVAWDNLRPGDPNRAVSAPILFVMTNSDALVQEEKKAGSDAAVTLGKLVALQRANLNLTVKLEAALATVPPDQWTEVQTAQVLIRRISGELLANPKKPLGALTEVMRKVFQGPMNEVVDVLDRVPKCEGAAKGELVKRAIDLENDILRVLTQVESGIDRVQVHQSVTGLLALMDALVKGQQEVILATRAAVETKRPLDGSVVQRQDGLAADLAEFVRVSKTEAQNIEGQDKEFSALILKVADLAESKKIKGDMLKAAELLEATKPADALPVEATALAGLLELQKMLNEWRMAEAKEEAKEMLDVLAEADAKMEKLVKAQSNIVQSIRQTEHQKNKDTKAYDEMMDELEEVKSEMAEALLKIATDLHVLPELPVGNDLVEDVSQVYEEMKQEAGSEKAGITEQALQKEDFVLELMKGAAGRIDDMEMWLSSKPDALTMNTESFDKAELEKNGPITISPLPTRMEDIIGDLMKQQEDLSKKAEDSNSNQGTADMLAGWDIKEGQWANYSGKGKSGNEAPDHKEQDGRSGLGREGMSDGEAVAGSGAINEGDKNIEERRTKDSAASGQIQEEGNTKAKATGGGKEGGTADGKGMAGDGPRRDSSKQATNDKGMQEMMRKDTETLYAQASLQHVRTAELGKAIRHMRQAEDAMAKGLPIRQVREHQRQAVMALKESLTELDGGFAAQTVENVGGTDTTGDALTASVPDEAPGRYKDMVADYFKALATKKD